MDFLLEAIRLGLEGAQRRAGGPFGAVVVKEGRIVGRGCNEVVATNDPTAHAEVVAVRDAARRLGTYDLGGCELYATCEPCPMCLGAIYWARIAKVYFANTRADAAAIGFQDASIYEDLAVPLAKRRLPFVHVPREEARAAFKEWSSLPDRVVY